MNPILLTSAKDNVVTCLRALKEGEEIEIQGRVYKVKQDIPQFHKLAIKNIAKGEFVYKYGQTIGVATTDILEGDYVHIHNVESTRGRGDKK